MDLLTQKHRNGFRFEPVESIAGGDRVAVQLRNGHFQVFAFEGDDLVLMQDCVDREDALAKLG